MTVILVGILILLLILWLLWPRKKSPSTSSSAPTNQKELVAPVQFAPAQTRPASTPVQSSVETVARTFAERYDSFSVESDFANLRDLLPLMTASFAARTEAIIKAGTSSSTGSFGMSAKAITISTKSFTETDALVEVGLQEVKETNGQTTTGYRTLGITLVKSENGWLVDGVAPVE